MKLETLPNRSSRKLEELELVDQDSWLCKVLWVTVPCKEDSLLCDILKLL